MKLWIQTPYPGEEKGEGKWTECKSPYEKRMWFKHNKHNLLPTKKQKEQPSE